MTALLLLVPLLPLLAAAAAIITDGRQLSARGLVVGAIGASFVIVLVLPAGTDASATWLETEDLRLTVGLAVDPLGRFAAALVAGISLLVGIYSLGYVTEAQARFFGEYGLFVGAMLALVLADSLVVLFAAWEIVGVASYLLIAFHHDRQGAAQAATKAFLMTRLGDVGLLLGWLLALFAVGSTEIAAVTGAAESGRMAAGTVTLIAFLILAGVIGKSAQLPLTGWLPDAMIGPTPVSALIHSATMVAAGVFLVLRLYPLFQAAPPVLDALVWIGAATALLAALVATAEQDLKRLLAWSTSSHLGEMMVALGLGGPLAASLHLAAHAIFKSTLFLAAGAIERRTGTRDLAGLGGLIRPLPVTGGVFLVAALALAGIPPFAGFWSEEELLGTASRYGPAAILLFVLLVALAGLYVGRAFAASFLGPRRTGISGSIAQSMRIGMVLSGTCAATFGWVWIARPEALLPFSAAQPAGVGWTLLGVAAGSGGLAVGALGARATAAPALGSWPAALGGALMRATAVPASWTVAAAHVALRIEAALDGLVNAVAGAAMGLSLATRRSEAGLDGAAVRSAEGVSRIADETENAEALGFARGADRFAAGLALLGTGVAGLQTGRLYLYTLGLFSWATLALAAAALVAWL